MVDITAFVEYSTDFHLLLKFKFNKTKEQGLSILTILTMKTGKK
jgi:hypothetical protein